MLVSPGVKWIRTALLLAITASGCDSSVGAAPRARAPKTLRPSAHVDPGRPLEWVKTETLCVTKGKLASARVEVPTFRAVALDRGGDGAAAKFVVHGATATERALASGQERRQIGLKLRAENGCNLVYVMWRLDPRPQIDVSVKRNVGQKTAKECGAEGYTKVRPTAALTATELPRLDDNTEHELRAEINGDRLVAWVDGRVAWIGSLPETARTLAGPAGVRSDNLDFELRGLAVDAGARADVAAKCLRGDEATESD
jgi:hypothetical protein